MESKEALENWYNTESPATKAYEYELHYRIIKKDLEVLEILKNKCVDTWNIKSTSTVKRYNEIITKYDGCDTFNLTESEYNKIKEWLEK